MKNLTIFGKMNEAKYKLVPALCSVALATAVLPVYGYAADSTSVNHTVTISTENGKEIVLSGEELETLLNVEGDTISIYQDGELIQLDRRELENVKVDNQEVAGNNSNVPDNRVLAAALCGAGGALGLTALVIGKKF